jgi:hypothetical protein
MTMATEQEHEQLRSLMTEGFLRAAGDIQSHHAAINRLGETIADEHAKVSEMAELVNQHSQLLETMQKVWTQNFAELGALVNQQTKIIEALRSLVLPQAGVN